jgi:transcriptional regulator with XRE-family HTH domain
MGSRPTDDFYEALGTAIKVLRTDRGMERKDLAERAGISYSYLASIESGTKQPSSQVLVAIAEALGLRSHELLLSVENRRDRAAAAAPSGDPWWLVGDKPARPRPAPQAAFGSPAAMASSRSFDPRDTFGTDLAGFIAEITELAERLTVKERMVVLQLARKLAEQRR